jgi:cobalt/nickel transport system ATP-binding protein
MADSADRAPHHLSYGERRRVAIATALAIKPEILVLDEPTSNLDPASRRELIEVLRELPVTQLVATHDLPFALELCPRALVMDQGRIVAADQTADILTDDELMRRHRLELPYRFDPRAQGRA